MTVALLLNKRLGILAPSLINIFIHLKSLSVKKYRIEKQTKKAPLILNQILDCLVMLSGPKHIYIKYSISSMPCL